MNTSRDFAVNPPDMRMPAIVIGITVLVCTGAIAVTWPELAASRGLWWLVALALLAPAMIVAAVMRRRVRIEDGVLHVVAGLNQTRVPLSELAPDDARIVDL